MQLTCKNQHSELELLAERLNDFASQYKLPSKLIFQVNLALDELLTNTISYGYDDENEHLINISITASESLLTIEISDDGRPFDPLALSAVDTEQSMEERQIGGLGIHIVRHLMDEMEYNRENGLNKLILRKRLQEGNI